MTIGEYLHVVDTPMLVTRTFVIPLNDLGTVVLSATLDIQAVLAVPHDSITAEHPPLTRLAIERFHSYVLPVGMRFESEVVETRSDDVLRVDVPQLI